MSQTESFEDFLERNGLSRFQNDLKKNGVFSSSELLCEIKSKNSKLIENLKPSTTEKLRMERAISFLQKEPIDRNGCTAVDEEEPAIFQVFDIVVDAAQATADVVDTALSGVQEIIDLYPSESSDEETAEIKDVDHVKDHWHTAGDVRNYPRDPVEYWARQNQSIEPLSTDKIRWENEPACVYDALSGTKTYSTVRESKTTMAREAVNGRGQRVCCPYLFSFSSTSVSR